MKIRQILNILALLVTLVVNGLANALPLNGKLTGEISDSFPVLFTPAGYVFAIWGVIYLLLLVFVIFQALPSQRDNPRLERLGYWFVIGCVFNSIWIFFWHYTLFPLTELSMLGLLVSLVASYLVLDIGKGQASFAEKIFINLPFSVYLGWVSVATIANTAILLYDLGWRGQPFGEVAWTIVVILVATGLGAAMIWLRREIAYPLVLVWAFIGINAKQTATPGVAVFAATMAVMLVLIWLVRLALTSIKPRASLPTNQ